MDPITIIAIATAAVATFDSGVQLITDLVRDPSGTKAKLHDTLAKYNLGQKELNQVYDQISKKLSAISNISYGLLSDVLKSGSFDAAQKLNKAYTKAQGIEQKITQYQDNLMNAENEVIDYQNKTGVSRLFQKQVKGSENKVRQADKDIGAVVDEINQIKREI